MVGAVVLAMTIALVGTGLTTWSCVPLRLEERLGIGVVTGVVATSAATFVGFELFGMGWGALGIGLVVPAVPAALGAHRHRARLAGELRSARRRAGLPMRQAASLRPAALLSVAAAVVTVRVLSLAYQTTDTGIAVGNLAVWGDWSAHLAYAGSFAYGDNRGLDLPTASGAPFRYHLMADFLGALFTVPGLDLPQALVWSAGLIALTIPLLLFSALRRVLHGAGAAMLAAALFLLTGGLGFWYFVQDMRVDAGRIGALPRTYARIPDQHLWLDNTISASLYAQRSTLLGLAVGLSALIVLLRARPGWRRSGFVAAGLLVGAMGIGHVHTLVSAVALATLALLRDRRAPWLWFLGPAVAVGAPLTWAVRPASSHLRWLPGWLAGEADQLWPWFWLRNAGLFLPLFAAIAFFGGVPRRIARLTLPLWLWFVVPNLISPHPWPGNNTKFFLFWQLAGCTAIAAAVARWWRAGRGARRRVVRFAVPAGCVLLVVLLTLTGALDAVRSVQPATRIHWVDDDEVAVARWLRRRADAEDTLVYGATNYSAVAALGGVSALSGYPGWTFDLGLPDWDDRVDASIRILRGGVQAEALVARHGVDYVLIGRYERDQVGASDEHWRAHGRLLYERGEYCLYGTEGPAP